MTEWPSNVRGYDWTLPPFEGPPPVATEIGHCSYLSSYTDYDESGDPFEDHESHRIIYSVLPTGQARIRHECEAQWGSGEIEITETLIPAGQWVCDYWHDWPTRFGSRAGCRILPVPLLGEQR